MLTKSVKIINVEEINSRALQLQFNIEWTMDDLIALVEHILLSISANVIETVQGADLYCVRIKYRDYELLLNFEEYSHACWLECITEQDGPGLQEIKRLMLNSCN